MILKDVIQELKKYLKEFDTNIKSIKKVGSKVVFKVEEDVRIRQAKKEDKQDHKFEIKEE